MYVCLYLIFMCLCVALPSLSPLPVLPLCRLPYISLTPYLSFVLSLPPFLLLLSSLSYPPSFFLPHSLPPSVFPPLLFYSPLHRSQSWSGWGVATPRFWTQQICLNCGRVVKYYILSCTGSMFESGHF